MWEHDGARWQAVQVLDPSVPGAIEDVSISGDWIAFGHPRGFGPEAPSTDGYVAVFRYTGAGGWIEDLTLSTPDFTGTGSVLSFLEMHNFGWAVDIEPGILFVGAPDSRRRTDDQDGPGFVFTYTRSGSDWRFADWLTSDRDVGDPDDPWRLFGTSVDMGASILGGGWLIVGAPKEISAGPNEYGAAVLFEASGSGWSYSEDFGPIFEPDPGSMDFGRHVANDRGIRLVAAADEGLKIMRPPWGGGNWMEANVMLPGRQVSPVTDGVDFDSERVLYVDSANDEVAVVSIVDNQWAESQVLAVGIVTTEPVGVAISGQRAAVGYPYEDLAGPNTGATITYREESDVLVIDETLVFGDATPGDKFGVAIDVASTGGGNALAIVGAPQDRLGEAAAGAAYIYRYIAF